ncbi:MAG TPA: DUF4147 domain-containing protein [Allosphingosinicella sp.]|nr:DUF4147 domain-containing protein [Allosphingosinicella sp.]
MRAHLERIFRAGVAACQPASVLPPHLSGLEAERILVLAVGKAAAGMAAAAEAGLHGRIRGIAVVPHGVEATLGQLDLVHAGHPLPDEDSVAAAKRLLALAAEAESGDLVLVLLSGGASALACLPGEGLTLEEKREISSTLLRSGAPIGEINKVRRHLSRFKGGRLALAAAPARLLTLAISDVVGDRPEDIGSGPTVADPSQVAEAKAILAEYGIAGPAEGWSETAKKVSGEYRIVARNADALVAAAAEARQLGYEPRLIEDCTGEARVIGRAHAELALASPPGTALISGGELTVTANVADRGGPNQEYAMAAALRLAGRRGICGLAADTDGIDGSSDAAGALFDGDTPTRSGRRTRALLDAHDSHAFFRSLDDHLLTGPTGTNVNDLRIILTAP